MFLTKRKVGTKVLRCSPQYEGRARLPQAGEARNLASIDPSHPTGVTTETIPTRAETSSPPETTPPPHIRKSTQKSVQYNSSDTPQSPIPCTANSHSIAAQSPISASNPLPATSPPLPESPPK